MKLFLFLLLVCLLFVPEVNGISAQASVKISKSILKAVRLVIIQIKKIIHAIKNDKKLRRRFTRRTIDQLLRKDDRMNYLVVRDFLWRKSAKWGLISKKHVELPGKLGFGTYGYEIAAFNRRVFNWFEKKGDGGYINWAYGGRWNRKGRIISYNPPRSPRLPQLVGKCVNVFNPHHYKYLRSIRGRNYVNAKKPATYERFRLDRHGGKYYLYPYGTRSYLKCNNRIALLIHPSPVWLAECKRSGNCYGIKLAATNRYFSAQPNGRLQCNRRRVRAWEVFIIEPCFLFF